MSKSIKEKIRYWYYFLNLAHDLDYEKLNRNLRKPKVKKLYDRFGNYRMQTFKLLEITHTYLRICLHKF